MYDFICAPISHLSHLSQLDGFKNSQNVKKTGSYVHNKINNHSCIAKIKFHVISTDPLINTACNMQLNQ